MDDGGFYVDAIALQEAALENAEEYLVLIGSGMILLADGALFSDPKSFLEGLQNFLEENAL